MIRTIAPLLLIALTACRGEDLTLNPWTSGADGFDTTSYWTETADGVVVFDAQFTPDIAAAMLADIRAETDAPIAAVVVSHPNPDKFLGAPVFQAEGAELVASEATADALPEVWAYKEAYFVGAGMFTEESFPALPTVDRTFSGELTLDQGGITLVELEHAGVSSTQTVAVVGDDLVVGDLVAGAAHAWLEGGIVDGAPSPDLAGWSDALDELPALGAGSVYPGRGQVQAVDVAVSQQQAYLSTMDGLVADYVAGLDDPMAALTGEDAGAHYAEITSLAEAAFPSYDLSYLVTYGVYGLALQHAQLQQAQ